MGAFVHDSVLAVRELGHTVTVWVLQPWTPAVFGYLHADWRRPKLVPEAFPAESRPRVLRIISVPRQILPRWSRSRLLRAVRKALQHSAEHFDIVHLHTEGLATALLESGNPFTAPVVATLHGEPTGRALSVLTAAGAMARALNRVTRIILVGESLRTVYSRWAPADPPFDVVANGIDIDAGNVHRERQRDPAELRLISVSNLHSGKGIDLTIKALGELQRSGCCNWVYRIAGSGAEDNRLRRLVVQQGIDGRTEFLGEAPHARIPQLLSSADVFVLPSFREAFGIAYLEAMQAGLYTIAVRGQGPEAFISHRRTGGLIAANNVSSLADELRFVMENRDEAEEIARAGRELVCREFSWQAHARALESVYRGAVASGGEASRACG